MNPRIYRTIRFFKRGGQRTLRTGLTLAEAQAHCNDPETSSSTAKGYLGRRITRIHGDWFDGYDLMRGISRSEN